jgi:hypothetical protein
VSVMLRCFVVGSRDSSVSVVIRLIVAESRVRVPTGTRVLSNTSRPNKPPIQRLLEIFLG